MGFFWIFVIVGDFYGLLCYWVVVFSKFFGGRIYWLGGVCFIEYFYWIDY